MVTFEGNLIQLSQGGTIVCWVYILIILRHHKQRCLYLCRKMPDRPTIHCSRGSRERLARAWGDVIQGDSTHRNKTMQSERNLKATRSDASKLSSVLDKIISHSACGRYDDSYLLIISWNNALLRQHTRISRPQIYAHQSYRSFCRPFYWCKFGLFNSLV